MARRFWLTQINTSNLEPMVASHWCSAKLTKVWTNHSYCSARCSRLGLPAANLRPESERRFVQLIWSNSA